MIKKYDEIASIYKSIYTELETNRVVLTSEEFFVPTQNDVRNAVEKHSVTSLHHIKNISDCEKHAWYLHSAIQRERSENALDIPEEERYTWSFGWCIGIRSGLMGSFSHTMCTSLTSDNGIIIIESESNLIEIPDIRKFNVLFVCM